MLLSIQMLWIMLVFVLMMGTMSFTLTSNTFFFLSMFCPADCAGRGVCVYNSSAVCTEGTCRYRAACSCFDKNDTTALCSETNILDTKVFHDSETSTLYAMLIIGGAVVGLVMLFFAWKWKKEKDRE